MIPKSLDREEVRSLSSDSDDVEHDEDRSVNWRRLERRSSVPLIMK